MCVPLCIKHAHASHCSGIFRWHQLLPVVLQLPCDCIDCPASALWPVTQQNQAPAAACMPDIVSATSCAETVFKLIAFGTVSQAVLLLLLWGLKCQSMPAPAKRLVPPSWLPWPSPIVARLMGICLRCALPGMQPCSAAKDNPWSCSSLAALSEAVSPVSRRTFT